MKSILREARERFKKGDYFKSASGLLAKPLMIHSIKISENYPNMIINTENGGIIAILEENGEVIWAEKI